MSECRLLSIGRFAQISGLTVTALRYYDRIGLLHPARVDDHSRYRLYSADQLERATKIAALRHFGLSIESIAGILDAPAEEARRILVEQRDSARLEIDRLTGVVAEIDRLLEGGEMDDARSVVYEVSVETLARQTGIGRRRRVAAPDVDEFVRESLVELVAERDRLGVAHAGAPFAVHSLPDEHDMVEVQVVVPVDDAPSSVDLVGALGFTAAVVALGAESVDRRVADRALLAALAADLGLDVGDETVEFFTEGPRPELERVAWRVDRVRDDIPASDVFRRPAPAAEVGG